MKPKLVEATINLYENVSNTFKPKPSSLHYVYNLRDVSKVFIGISISDKVALYDCDQIIKIWLHESERIFYDRLLIEDQNEFNKIVSDILKKSYNTNYNEISNNNWLIFGR